MNLQHKVKLTVIDKKLYPELQETYCADKNAGMCPCYNVGDEFIFERSQKADDFWHMGLNTLKQTANAAEKIAGSTAFPHCSEAWDAISRYIYAGLQGGSIMRGWMEDERVMIACCSDGTRPVIFKIERMDYKEIVVEGMKDDGCRDRIREALTQLDDVTEIAFCEESIEVYLKKDVEDEILKKKVEGCGKFRVTGISEALG